DDDSEAILIAAGKALRSDLTGLLDVTRVALLDGDNGKLPRSGLVRPDATNVRNAGSLQLFPYVGGPRNRAQQGQRVRRPRRIRARENRVVAMKNPFHADKWLEAFRTGVVPGPFAKRTFFLQLTGSDFSLENNFCIGRIRQAGDVTANDVDGVPLEAAGEVELANAGRHRARCGKPNQRIAAEHEVDWHRLSFLG